MELQGVQVLQDALDLLDHLVQEDKMEAMEQMLCPDWKWMFSLQQMEWT